MRDEPLEFQSSDADADDGKKWDQALEGQDFDLDADGGVDDDVQADEPAAGTTPSPDQV
jgi:hypothetical protein